MVPLLAGCLLLMRVVLCTPTYDCPDYVREGLQLDCTCLSGCEAGNVTWPGYSDSARLQQHDVTRAQNGSEFICQEVCDGEKVSNITYVLKVSYGPGSVEIAGPEGEFVTDGSRDLTLECQARDVYPEPEYLWQHTTCINTTANGRICTIHPVPDDDGADITCIAEVDLDGYGPYSAFAIYKLNVSYPPPSAPVIMGERLGQTLKTGHILTCKITGGKPVVKKVRFSCWSPDLHGGPDTDHGDALSSSVVVNSTEASEQLTVCMCSARWEPEPRMYEMYKETYFHMEYRATVQRLELTNSKGTLSNNLTVNRGDSASVYCVATGRPPPDVVLMKDDGHGMESVHGLVTAENLYTRVITYEIPNATLLHEGQYACLAKNGLGTPDVNSAALAVSADFNTAATDNGMCGTLFVTTVISCLIQYHGLSF